MNEIYTFALVTSFYNKGKDYLDAFLPMILRCLPTPPQKIQIAELRDAVLSRSK